jgi:hypothetical protein
MQPPSKTPSSPPVPVESISPPPWVRWMIAVLLRLGLGVILLNGGLLGYQAAQRGGVSSASSLASTTLLGPAAVAGVLENDLLVPIFQIALGLALILGFFTVASSVVAGFFVLSGPIFQFLAILSSNATNTTAEQLAMQALVTTGSINLLLLVALVLWLTPPTGTPWSLDYLIFSHRRSRPAAPAREPMPADVAVAAADAAAARDVPAGALSASRGE